MNKPEISLTTLLERLESEFETAGGRTVRLCRDASGNYWVVDGAERVMSLSTFAAECNVVARGFCAQARAESFRRMAARAKEVFAGVAKALQQVRTKTAHA
jgi:hypothetical protein